MRKKFHKILSLSLAAVMVFSMAVPSYAAAPPDVPAESIVAEEAVNDADVQDTNEPAPAEAPDAVPAPVPDETPAEEAKPDDVSNTPADEEAPAPEIPDEEPPKEEEPEVPAEPLTHKVKFLAGSDAHGVIFVDGEEVDIASFVMELYPEDTVTFGVEPNSMDYVVSAVDFTGDCSLEAVEGSFVLKDVKTDVDLLVTYEEGTPTQDTALLATTYDLSAEGDGSITASLNGTTLTVTGSGAMGNWTDRTSPVYGVCTSVTKIVLDNRITYIGNYAFNNFTALTSVEGGSGVTSIGNYAFNRCSVLRSVNFPALKTLGTHVFYRCAKLGSNEAGNGNIPLDFPELVTAGDYAFYGCNWLEQLNVPKLERIGQMCFMNSCVGEGNFPALKSYGAHAFVGRTDIPSFTFGALEDCSDWLINQMPGCSLISMPNLTNISYNQAPFDNVGATIGSNTGVGQLRVEWPKLMNSSWVPTAKWSIPDNTVFVLPEGSNLTEPLTNLGYTVEHPADDSGNPKLSSLSVTLTRDMLASDLVIPFSVFPENASVSNIQYTIYNADGTTTSTAADASRALVSNDVDGAVFVIRSLQLAKMWRNANTVRNAFDIEFESGQTIRFTVYTPTHETPAGEWNIGKTESDNVTAMLVGSELRIYGSGTMKEWDIGKTPWNRKTITKIIIGDGVLNIGHNMGYNLRSLVSVTGGADVTDIGRNAFANCTKLQTVECMGQAKSIDGHAFEYCSSLKSVDISSCESFGYSVFRGLNNVREIILGQSYDSNSFFDQSFPKLETVRAEFVVLPSNFPFLGDSYSGTNCGLSNASGVLTVELPNCVSSLWEPTAESRARCAARTIVKVPGNTEFADKLRAAGYEVEGQVENPSNAVLAKTEIDPTVEIVTGGLSIPFSSIDDSATAVTNVTAVHRGKSQYTVKRSKDLFSIDRSGSEVMLVVNKDAVFCNSYKSSAEAPFIADYYVTLNDEAGSVVRFTINYENTEFWDVSEEQNRSLIAVVSYDTNTMEIVGDGTFKTGRSAQSGSDGISHGFGYPQFKGDKDYHLILDDRLISLPSGCFSGMNFVDIQGGANIRSIGIGAFKGCKKLTTVSFPSVEMIESDAFYGCSNLKQVIMPNVTNVSSSSFRACGFDELTSETLQFSDSWSIGVYKYAFTEGHYKKVDLPNLKNPGCNNFNSRSAFDHIVYTVGEHMYEDVNLKSAHFPGLKSLDVNLFEPAKADNIAIADGLYFEDLTSLKLANLHPKSWESSSFDIYIPKCTSLSAAGHNLPEDVLFHIPNNRTVIEECNRYNLKYVIDGSAEMDDAEVTLRLYDLTDETFTTLKTVRLSVSGADGIGYTEQYTIPDLSTLLGIGKDYAGLISVTGSWTDGGVKREGDKVFFAAPADKNLVVTYTVYDYGTIAEMTPVKEHIAPKVEVPYTFDIYTTPTSGGYTHYTRRAFVLYNPDGTLNVSVAKCVKYYYKREKGTELTSYVADEIMKHITISPDIYEIDMERGLFTDEHDIADISCYVYLKFKSDLSDAFSHTVTFMDEDEVVRTWSTADSDTIYAPDRPGRAGYKFLGWA